jgi:hypothetical protein
VAHPIQELRNGAPPYRAYLAINYRRRTPDAPRAHKQKIHLRHPAEVSVPKKWAARKLKAEAVPISKPARDSKPAKTPTYRARRPRITAISVTDHLDEDR